VERAVNLYSTVVLRDENVEGISSLHRGARERRGAERKGGWGERVRRKRAGRERERKGDGRTKRRTDRVSK
jgi:hypothetical protein